MLASEQISVPETGATAFKAANDLLSNRELESALHEFSRAEKAGYSADQCAAGRWQCWMFLGEFEFAWRESDQIRRRGAFDPQHFWTGETWSGKRTLVRCLHGLGDTIQFIRYAPVLRECCSRLIVQVHPELVRLVGGVDGVDEVFSWPATDPAWDVQMEVTELPYAFRTKNDTVPKPTIFRIPRERSQWAKQVLATGERRFRVGLIWQAGPFDPTRSISFEHLHQLFDLNGVEFFSLQKDTTPGETKAPIRDLSWHIQDVLDTASLMQEMDLIITVDTMTTHLAGSLNRPTWILLPYKSDWRWMVNRDDSPWYDRATLFRQAENGNWQKEIALVTERLRRHVASALL